MVSQLLYELPSSETYRVIFMERDLDEMIRSQEKMLSRLGKPSAPTEAIKQHFTRHLEKLRAWLSRAEQLQAALRAIQGRRGEPQRGSRASERVPSRQDRHGGDGENG